MNQTRKRSMFDMALFAIIMFVAVFAYSGCKTATAKLPTGAINTFDAASFQTLMTAQAALNTLKQSEPANPAMKPYLNQAITDYNTAEAAWQAYHSSGSNASGVSAALATLSVDILKIQGLIPETNTRVIK